VSKDLVWAFKLFYQNFNKKMATPQQQGIKLDQLQLEDLVQLKQRLT